MNDCFDLCLFIYKEHQKCLKMEVGKCSISEVINISKQALLKSETKTSDLTQLRKLEQIHYLPC